MILIVCLNPAIDRVSLAECLRRENVKKIKNTQYSAGGKGVNAARVLNKLGAASLTIGFSGGDTGVFFEALLESEGLEGRFIRIDGLTRINVTLLGEGGGGGMHIVDPGPAVKAEETELFRDLFAEAIGSGRISCAAFCGSLPRGVPGDFYRELIGAAKKRGIRTALDSSGAPLKKGLRAKPDLIKPNSRELDELAGVKLGKISRKMDFALGLKMPETVVTMGKRGAFAAGGEGIVIAGAAKSPGGNSVGSGDALLAGYIFSRMIKRESMEKALLTGSACAAAGLSGRLPGRISPAVVKNFEKIIKVKRLKT